MQTLSTLLACKGKLWMTVLTDRSRDALARTISTAVVLLALLYTAYRLFYDIIFSYVASLRDIGFLLIDRLVSTGFMAFFLMLVISSFVAAIAIMFRSDETEYLFSTPVSELELFTSKYIDTAASSSWAVMVMAIPILVAYARVRGFGILEYILAGLFLLLPFILIATALGTMLALTAVSLSRRVSLRKLILAGGAAFIGFIYLFVKLSRPTELQIPFNEDFRALNLFINNFHLSSYPFAPNFWLVQGLGSLVKHDAGNFLLYAAALLSTAAFVTAGLYALGQAEFYSAWLASLEESARRTDAGVFFPRKVLTLSPSRGQIHNLLNKDALLFLRDPSQWAQFSLILILLGVYFFNLRLVPANLEMEQWRTIVAVINLGFSGFILATLAVRFIFPSISLEGGSFWVIVSAPLSVSTLFREKFWLSLCLFLLIAEPIAILSGVMLHLDGLYLVMTVGGIFLMSITLSCLAVGLGAAFPSFAESTPSRIASSPGGVLTIITALAYVGLMTALIAVPLYAYTGYLVSGGAFPRIPVIVCSALAVLLNGVLTVASLRMGSISLARREF
jgi:ABC-2 type transport system permease protein